MRVEQLGDGEPELAIVGGIHGDEPCGVRAIERLLETDPAVERPVKLIIVNERALEQSVRYVDADLNRAFDANVPADAHERVLAQDLAAEVEGCTVLSIHSTQSHADPFALSSDIEDHIRNVVPYLSVVALVDTGDFAEGRLFATNAGIIEVEAGYQGSETAAENAYTLSREFLTATGALPGDPVAHDVPVFEMGAPIPKPPADEYDVLVDNFDEVEEGETYAVADDHEIVAEDDFWPILLSAYGYRDVFGYRGEPAGTLTVEDAHSSSEANSTSVSSRSSAQ